MEASQELKHQAQALGFDLVGICSIQTPPHWQAYTDWTDKGAHASMAYLKDHIPLKQDPRNLLPTAQSIIAVALNYNQTNPPQPGYPRIARYALGRDYHKVLRAKLKRLQAWLQIQRPDSQHRACVDSAPIMERDFANLAGLGWFGKNTMLINSQRGSWFFLGILLTSIEFQPDPPAIGGCGTCRACIDACPTGAIVQEEGKWQVDARRCISYLTIEHDGEIEPELAQKMGDWTFGCDVCQEVCPFNHPRDSQPLRAPKSKEPDFLKKKTWPSLKELVVLNEKDWDQLTQGSPVRRTGIAGIKRNAHINLDNM
ncbi:MAG: tRNA epoxyqueuosine(34) reductase QueG [Chlorobia bacterium]|nr:tRNA epoxyqueuosine(34) reductase QueG [Fimbriimonadaceae bacterium]